MSRLRFAIIGCGRISYKHIEAVVKNFDEAFLVAVCDIVEEKAVKSADLYKEMLEKEGINLFSTGCNSQIAADLMIENKNTKEKLLPSIYTDYKEMLKCEEIDVITIATESGYHCQIALDCLNAEKHIIVEKPMALSTNDADQMIEIARKNNKKLCVCHQNRFNIPIQMLRTAIEKDRFGKLVNGTARVLWNRNMSYYTQAPWRGTWELDGGTLMNQCIHNIDLLQWMMGGEVDTVYAQTGNFLRDIEAEDFGAIMIRFKNGAIGLVEGTACVYPKNLEETLSIFGEKGTTCIGGLAVNKIETWRFADELDREEDILSDQDGDPDSVYGFGHTPLFKDLIEAIKEDREPLINGKEGKKAMNIILAAYKSQRDNVIIKMDNFEFSTLDMKTTSIKR